MLLKIVKPRPTAIISAIPPKKDVMKDSLLQSEWLLLSFLFFRIVIYYSIHTKTLF